MCSWKKSWFTTNKLRSRMEWLNGSKVRFQRRRVDCRLSRETLEDQHRRREGKKNTKHWTLSTLANDSSTMYLWSLEWHWENYWDWDVSVRFIRWAWPNIWHWSCGENRVMKRPLMRWSGTRKPLQRTQTHTHEKLREKQKIQEQNKKNILRIAPF